MPPRKTMNTNWNKTYYGATYRRTAATCTHYPCNSPKFRPVRDECQWRIGSYRNVYSQFAGGTRTNFSPATANKWIRYVNNGVRVYKFNSIEFTRHFGARLTYTTPTTARQFLRQKFGACIKDVTRGNGNCWLIATTKNVTGRPFAQYDWI
jgi:hypothetical protein